MAAMASAGFGDFPCHSGLFSMNDTPLPFTVCATTTWAALRRLRLIERLADLVDGVAVDLEHRPAEALPLADHRLQIEDLRDEIIDWILL